MDAVWDTYSVVRLQQYVNFDNIHMHVDCMACQGECGSCIRIQSTLPTQLRLSQRTQVVHDYKVLWESHTMTCL